MRRPIPAHSDVVLVCVRGDQLDDALDSSCCAPGPSVPVVIVTPMLPRDVRAHTRGARGRGSIGRRCRASSGTRMRAARRGTGSRRWPRRSSTSRDSREPSRSTALVDALGAVGDRHRVRARRARDERGHDDPVPAARDGAFDAAGSDSTRLAGRRCALGDDVPRVRRGARAGGEMREGRVLGEPRHPLSRAAYDSDGGRDRLAQAGRRRPSRYVEEGTSGAKGARRTWRWRGRWACALAERRAERGDRRPRASARRSEPVEGVRGKCAQSRRASDRFRYEWLAPTIARCESSPRSPRGKTRSKNACSARSFAGARARCRTPSRARR